MENLKNNGEKVSVSPENSVSLQPDNNINTYGTDNYRRAETSASADDATGRTERLGIHAYMANGRPTLDSRWDTLVYEEGLQSEHVDSQLGGSRLAVRNESERLITLARKLGDYIPSAAWSSFGLRNTKPSGESVVFVDEKNSRVIKFKDPFAYVSLKNDNPYNALYEHHIHNHFFGEVGYRFLGISQDPVNGDVRFAFEQPFIKSVAKPSKDQISYWFKEKGFELTEDGFWYTDGYVSFTDVWEDNCIKDSEGNLHFIDPIIKFERDPKEVLSHYIEQVNMRKEKLERAGIDVGSRFRIERLCSFNDMEVKSIDYGKGTMTFFHPNNHPDYQYECEWPINRVLENIQLNRGSRWIQVDENRKEIVVPQAYQALLERVKDNSPHASFTDGQIKALDKYCALRPNVPKDGAILGLLQFMGNDIKDAKIPEAWIEDVREEIRNLAKGERRAYSQGIKM